jgi:DNA helicase II / ATP-dependent DNA helicase PcrA
MKPSDQQQSVIDANGNLLLIACPGSGKTRAAAQRAARLVTTPNAKVALCSYTNVGADRASSVLAGLGITLSGKHFLGTIHTFLLRYVVYPFSNMLGAEHGPIVVDGATWPQVLVNGDNAQRIAIDCFRRHSNGDLIVTNRPRGVQGTDAEVVASVRNEVLRRKRDLFLKAGMLTADDAMWIALRLLREQPKITEAVAARFDEILLDEAQDTSELQLACLDALYKTGNLKSLVLVGDLEQSIYSFQGASAAGCQKLADDHGLETLTLSENFRSSQRICHVASQFCNRRQPDTAVGPHAACEIEPEVALDPAGNPVAAMDIYRGRLKALGLAVEDAVVLGRDWKMVDILNGGESLFKQSDRRYILGHLASRLAAGVLTASDIRSAERLLAYCAWDITAIGGLETNRLSTLRSATAVLLDRLPILEGDLRAWLIAARKAVQDVASTLAADLKHSAARSITVSTEYADHQASDVFSLSQPDLRARTVHSFKGEDSESIMMVIRRT